MDTKSIYTARCKSGYIWDGNKRPCARMCKRGALLCSECIDAQVVEVYHLRIETRVARLVSAFAAMLGVTS
jgi:hypothetical protein